MSQPDDGTGLPSGSLRQTLTDFAQNLKSGVRLAFWRPLTRADFRFSADQLVLLAALQLLLNLAVGVVSGGPDGSIDWDALPGSVFPLLLLLLAAYLVSKVYRRDAIAVELPIVLLASTPVFAAYFAVEDLLAQAGLLDDGGVVSAQTLYFVYLAWIGLVFAAALIVVGGRDIRRLALAAIALLVVAGLPQTYLPYAELWMPDEEAPAEAVPSAASEEVLSRQTQLLARALQSISPERQGIVDLYFVGFAGYGDQDVFMQEVDAARNVMETRFDARGRSVTLVNNPATMLGEPMATASNLAAVLDRVGEVMNPEEDILFLFLSSHGLPGQLEVKLDPLELRPLYPVALRRALDAAGIKWRVIVISACYSGSFIGALRDDHTLIITAADAENTSFGCSDDADFTYFGRAFFGDALQTTHSFTDAYRSAAEIIAGWEQRKGYPPSHPQMQMGDAITEKLRTFEARLATPSMR
ncbi:MAG: C13 family peptidase [Burkholderiales bacterium]